MAVPSSLRPRFALACALVGLVAHACGSTTRGVASDPDASAGAAGSAGVAGSASAGAAGASAAGGTAGSGGGAGRDAATDATTESAPCDPGAVPASGIFVAPDGSDTAGDGSRALPVATIARALDVAAATGEKSVYLAEGTYAEAVHFESQHEDLAVEGGWKRVGASWERDCSPGARTRTLIASPGAVGVRVDALARRSVLRRLSIATKSRGASSADQDGESLYGVFVAGPDAAFGLEDVAVQVGHGGDGGAATDDIAGVPQVCADLALGCGDGTDASGGGGGADAPSGAFQATGYVPAAGTAGEPGQAGANGTPGQPGEAGSCFPGGCTCPSPGCGTVGNRAPKSGGHGRCGCGGTGGTGGAPGRGGGASVGVFAAGAGVIVSLSSVTVVAGDGGDGSQGRPGGAGASGGGPAAGSAESCPEDCVVGSPGVNCVNDGCNQTGRTLAGGVAGGPGGKGGAGGPGGGGAGGPSFAVVALDGASVLATASSLSFGQPGAGGGSAPAGAAGERHVP